MYMQLVCTTALTDNGMTLDNEFLSVSLLPALPTWELYEHSIDDKVSILFYNSSAYVIFFIEASWKL